MFPPSMCVSVSVSVFVSVSVPYPYYICIRHCSSLFLLSLREPNPSDDDIKLWARLLFSVTGMFGDRYHQWLSCPRHWFFKIYIWVYIHIHSFKDKHTTHIYMYVGINLYNGIWTGVESSTPISCKPSIYRIFLILRTLISYQISLHVTQEFW